jgi:hypothetical protein
LNKDDPEFGWISSSIHQPSELHVKTHPLNNDPLDSFIEKAYYFTSFGFLCFFGFFWKARGNQIGI